MLKDRRIIYTMSQMKKINKKIYVFLPILQILASILCCSCVSIQQNAVYMEEFAPSQPADGTKTIVAVQISDAHFSKERPIFDCAVKTVNGIDPDIIFFTGDQATSTKSIEIMQHYMEKISVKCPKLAIYGNWELSQNIPLEKYAEALQSAGVQLLKNEAFNFEKDGMKLNIYGLDDLLFGKPDFSGFERKKDAANVVLGHCPPLFDQLNHAEEAPVTMISGHTHGGQFVFFGHAIYFPEGTGEYYAGIYKNGGDTLYVSTGLGNSTYDIRNVPPQIDIITFVFDSDNNFIEAKTQAIKVK